MKRADLVFSTVFFLIGCWVLWQATMLPHFTVFGPGPEFMPNVLAGLLLVLSLILFVTTMRKAANAGESVMPSREGVVRIVIIIASLFVYTFLIDVIGYLITTFAYCLFMMVAMGRYRWYISLAVTAAITAVFYWSFVTLLDVPVPTGMFGI